MEKWNELPLGRFAFPPVKNANINHDLLTLYLFTVLLSVYFK